MTALNLLKRGSQVLIGAVLLISIFLVNTENAEAQSARPHIPVLSLTGTDGSYDNNWFPDGRIFIPPSYQAPREILVPVFIDNRWIDTDHPCYKPDPIYSFSYFMDGGTFHLNSTQATSMAVTPLFEMLLDIKLIFEDDTDAYLARLQYK